MRVFLLWGAVAASLAIVIVVTLAIQRLGKADLGPSGESQHATVAEAILPRAGDGPTVVLRHAQLAPTGDCTCSKTKLPGGWCEACQIGYVAGLAVPSQLLYEAVDNHGHEVDPTMILCPTCIAAMQTDGLCDACRFGFIGGRLYVTPLAYWLGTGVTREPQRLTCPACRRNVETGGWCDACAVGMVGNVAVRDRKGFEHAVIEFNRLRLAVPRLDGCKWCALATYSNGTCPFCRIAYHEGEGTPSPKR